MKVFFVENRSISADNDGYVHLLPVGEFPMVIEEAGKNRDVLGLVDDKSLDLVMSAYQRDSANPKWTGYLIDQEHFSHDKTKSSEAFGWVKSLQRRVDGIWGLVEWTELGLQAIEKKIYKHLSPVLGLLALSANRGHVVAFSDAGLTNKPKLKTLVPIQCRDGQTQEEARMEKIRALFKLPADATEDQMVVVIQQALNRAGEADAFKARAESAEVKLDGLLTAALNRDADAFVEKHKDRITDAAKVKTLFVKNREAAEEFVALLKPAATSTQRVLCREDGKTPAGESEAANNSIARREYVEALVAKNRCTYIEAYNVGIAQRPDLFVS